MSAENNSFENKAILRDNLIAQIKAYRNFSIKLSLGCWIASFAGSFIFKVANTEPIALSLEETLFQSFQFSLVFAIIGYCAGSIIGAHMQNARLSRIQNERERRKAYIEEQVSIRQAKIDAL